VVEIRSVLAPTDFSPHAEGALRYAVGLAERLGATLHLLHVLPDVVVPVGPDPTLTPSLPPEYYTETEEQSLAALRKLLDPAWGKIPASEVAVRWGSPVDAIVAYAADQKIDLIVTATHGRTGLSHALLGSVAERIVREAPCPVLTLRDRR
jgi:universal stress protein A